MHLRRVHIRNVRSIAELTWELPPEVSGAGWHVILGNNGAGKSSFLRAIALVLVGSTEAAGLRQPWDDWLRTGTDEATIELAISLPSDNGGAGSALRSGSGSPVTMILRRNPKTLAAIVEIIDSRIRNDV